MGCNNPPLLAKPSRGYGWTCAPCSREHEEEVDSHKLNRHSTPGAQKPKSNAPAPRGRGRPRKDRVQAEKEEQLEIRHFKMWPFRYFGYVFREIVKDKEAEVTAGSTPWLRIRLVSVALVVGVLVAEFGLVPRS